MTITPAKAIAKYTKEAANNPQSAEAQANLGALYLQQQKWRQAQTCYRRAIKLNPKLVDAHLKLAKIWTHLGNDGYAANRLNQAYELQPDLATPQQHYQLGKTLQAQNKPERAISSYQRAINSKPDLFAAYQSLAQILIQQGQKESAIALYQQSIANHPQPRLHLGLGKTLATLEKWHQAIESYQTASQLAPNLAEVYYHWALSLVQIQNDARAEKYFQKAIALKTNYAQAYYHLGKLWQKQSKWQQAIAAYQQAMTIDPQNKSRLIDLASVYRTLGQYNLAIDCYREVIQNSSKPLQTRAIRQYQQTLAEDPQATIQDYYQLAKLLRAKGLFTEAIAAYQKTLELNPKFQIAYIDLQYTPVAKEQSAQLIEFYRQIVARHPEITIAWGNLGDALTKSDRIPEAIECYRKSSYTKAIQNYPYLAKLDWKEQKELAPDFIIAGASKSGTSSIYHYLGRHPQVLLAHKKEIDFYWTNYKRGIDWYLAHFPTITDYPDFLTGEATPNYLRFPKVAQRIKDSFPQTKIIILLRNPADRAISWHYHKLNSGLSDRNLTEAISMEIERLKTVSEAEIINTGFHDPDNIMSSLYIYKIKAWMEILGREQFLILKSEDFYQNPAESMAKVFTFLGLPDFKLDKYPQVNPGSYSDVDSSLRKTLVEYFAPYNQQLEEYLDLQFNWQ